MQVKIKSIYINSTNKEKKPLADKHGAPYKRAVLTTEDGTKASLMIYPEFEGVYMPTIVRWKAGDIVHVLMTESNGYTNFEPVSEIEMIKTRLSRIEGKLGLLDTETKQPEKTFEEDLKQAEEENKIDVEKQEPIDEVKVDDIPF